MPLPSLPMQPIVAWAIGTCAKMFTTEVQFGHAGSMANSDLETADAKNAAMRAAGFIVPDTFEDLPEVLKATYEHLVQDGTIVVQKETEPPLIPMDYKWAQELGMIRKPAAFISSISDERGSELLYAGMKISDVFKEEIGIGGVVSLLWFKRRMPSYACKFIEMVLQLTADHGPAVSGAMNTIITARAGKDLVSSLAAGLLTIGDRFGGALDGAAANFTAALNSGKTPREFVDSMRKQNKLIPGIGHKVKSKANPDLRVELLVSYVKANFPATKTLDYALGVEDVTSAKKDTLIRGSTRRVDLARLPRVPADLSPPLRLRPGQSTSTAPSPPPSATCSTAPARSPRRRRPSTSRSAPSTASSFSAGRSASSATTSTRSCSSSRSTATPRTTFTFVSRFVCRLVACRVLHADGPPSFPLADLLRRQLSRRRPAQVERLRSAPLACLPALDFARS
jgi:citrate synthase